MTRFSIVGLLFVLLAALTPTDQPTRDAILLKSIIHNLENIHYSPLEIDDELSGKAFDLYIERLDYGKLFLLKEDIERIKPFRKQLDDELKEGSLEFFEISNDLITKRIKKVEPWYKEILEKPFDFTVNEEFQRNPDSLEHCKSDQALKQRWRKSLKYQTLTRLETKLEQMEKKAEKSDTVVDVMSFEEAESWARERVMQRYDDWFSRLEQTNRSDRLTTFINSFIAVYDPHSEYYPPKAKEDFDIRFSGKLEGIGATLRQESGYIKVHRIVPGSASWRQGELEVGDLILKVAQEGEDFVDIVDMRMDDAVRLIRGPKGTEVRLSVQKVDGTTQVIPIVRDVVELEETFAKSAIIQEGGSARKIGYIKLPSFYMDFNKPEGRSAAKDVLAEIEDLKQEGIEGLVIDLRGNGGGSLLDAVKMAGFFIEKGPIVQVKSRFGRPYVFDDKDPDVQYDGPMVVLVNSVSASASEIFAAAMQDYHRAIIIGSPTTFGKGTVQRFFDLDKMVDSEYDDIKPLGSVKLTTQKFYRINGDATQLKGVTPDLILPDRYSYIDIGEKDRDYPMPWTEIDAAEYTPWNVFSINYEYIQSKEAPKVQSDPTFQLLDEQAKQIRVQRHESSLPLNLKAYESWKDEREAINKKYKKLGKDSLNLFITALPDDLEEMATDSVKRIGAKKWHGQLVKDIYLYEAVNLLNANGIVKSD